MQNQNVIFQWHPTVDADAYVLTVLDEENKVVYHDDTCDNRSLSVAPPGTSLFCDKRGDLS